MALPVAELVAAHQALVARTGPAMAAAVVATGRADAAITAATRSARRVAIDDVARAAVAEAGAIGLPPTGRDAPRRTRVASRVDRAAEHRPTRRAAGVGPAH